MLKKLSVFVLTVALAASFSACGGKQSPEDQTPSDPPGTEEPSGSDDADNVGKYIDGEYVGTANGYDDKGWQEVATVTITDGKIAKVAWDSQNQDTGTPSKLEQSLSGQYNMKAAGNAQAEWHEQAAVLCNYIVQTQDPDSVIVNAEGKTDAVAGCTISVGRFMEAFNNALAQAE